MTNFGIPFEFVLFNYIHIKDCYIYALFLFELSAPQVKTVVYVFKESSYFF